MNAGREFRGDLLLIGPLFQNSSKVMHGRVESNGLEDSGRSARDLDIEINTTSWRIAFGKLKVSHTTDTFCRQGCCGRERLSQGSHGHAPCASRVLTEPCKNLKAAVLAQDHLGGSVWYQFEIAKNKSVSNLHLAVAGRATSHQSEKIAYH